MSNSKHHQLINKKRQQVYNLIFNLVLVLHNLIYIKMILFNNKVRKEIQ